ncbi:sensor histidine kinase [Aestuariimicrobium soli]|uniref:sensor histidine kinase n=1 Tax=Aestuariimicrobium soli TaxID=2035834 RepID=UPI003EC04186
MLEFQSVGDGRRPPRWRAAVAIVPLAVCCLVSAAFSPLVHRVTTPDAPGWLVLLSAVTMLACVVSPLALFWRHRLPFALTIAAAVAPLVIPIGNTLAYVLLACLLARRRGPAVWCTAALVAVTSATVVALDATAQPREASFAHALLGSGPSSEPVPALVILIAAILFYAAAVGAGLAVRGHRLARVASAQADSSHVTSRQLGDEVARQQERVRIAREVHDAMGHRLSLLSLHAGAVELHAADSPALQASARLVRQSVGEAMHDLTSLLTMLREPSASELPEIPLSEMTLVVRDAVAAGQSVSSSVFVEHAERADPALTRAAFRTVQELLTNARKHAPGEPVWLQVQGGPDVGLAIETVNRYLGGLPPAPGGARGLLGIRERAELLGGRVDFGLDQGGSTFRVRVELPWRGRSR